ncbi:nucleotide disphospho-sugar-binding domain-containing protein [Hyunsoonleella rubra]|uniref:Nucleotide disphospho-sugar-binding domain-containing protein n=1 Tax=Hyunsoonleella rubra TaxID=1737062 RepID=A0ABW5TD79_9FLAO
MAHIALIITGLTGRLFSSFEMATRLEKEGHKITYLCPMDVKEKVESIGFDYVQLPEINYNFEARNQKNKPQSNWIKRLGNHFRQYSTHYTKGKEILGLDVYNTILNNLNPHHIIIDVELHDIIFASLNLDAQITLFTAWFNNEMRADLKLPPIRTCTIPGKGIKGSWLGILLSWTFVKLKVRGRIIVNKLKFRDYRRSVLKTHALKQGMPSKNIILSNLPDLFAYTNIPTISMTLAEMDFPHDPPNHFKYIGPMVYEQREMKFDKNVAKMIENVVKIKSESEKKLIYFSASSFINPEMDYINRVIKAVKDRRDWLMIVSLGGKLNPSEFESVVTDNVYILSWVPQLQVLNQADCCITHCGVNSLNECIYFGVPMLAYSGKYFEQSGNAARIHFHKLGIMGDKDKDSPKIIEKNLERVLDDLTFKNNADRFKEICKVYEQKRLSSILNLKS